MLLCNACGHKAYKTNSGYYCRNCPKGQRMLIPADLAERVAVALVATLSVPEIVAATSSVASVAAKKIAQLEADIKQLSPRSPDYVTRVSAMAAEIQSLEPQLHEPDQTIVRETGRTIGQAFAGKPRSEQRAFLLENVRLAIRGTEHGWDMELWPRMKRSAADVLAAIAQASTDDERERIGKANAGLVPAARCCVLRRAPTL